MHTRHPLQILHLEDNVNDAELVRTMLVAEGIVSNVTLVQSRDEFSSALDQGEFDLIISDFTLPSFDGAAALAIAREKCPDIPFIFVSGTIGEDAAIESLLNGATDYVLKHKSSRLVPAVRRALREAEERKERRRAEEALVASERKYREFFEDDLTGDYIATPNGRLLDCNLAFVRMFGFASIEEAKRSDASSLYFDSKEREAFLALLCKRKRLEYHERELCRRDGTPLHVVENVVGAFDERGELVQIKGYLFDDTKRKHLEQQLIQAQKMESIGTLAGGIAHDFNNILGIILGHASIINASQVDATELARSTETIRTAAQRGALLVRQLLTFARKTDVVFERINVNTTVEELIKMINAMFPKTITCSVELGTKVPLITADVTQLYQALVNLCVNARDAMPKGGTLSISTGTISGVSLQKSFPEAKHSEYLLIKVSDTGIGMDRSTRKRIFEPFFTTKDKGKGTGLGLSVLFGIINTHHGFVDVESEPGRGTTFRLFFPVEQKESRPTGVKICEAQEEVPGGTETVLVVEDEAVLLELVRSLLEGKGYHVLIARDGFEAVSVYAEHHQEIAIVFSDFGLPKRNGWEAFIEMKKVDPNVKAIIATGYVAPLERSEMLTQGLSDIIQKPYTWDLILRKIREVLDCKKT